MPRKTSPGDQIVRIGRDVFLKLPPRTRFVVAAALLLALVAWFVVQSRPGPAVPPPTGAEPDGSAGLMFCFWNVENLFDDQDDKRRSVDEEFDNSFADNATLRNDKLDRIASTLLRMNGGRGPDVIACVEVESVRAADLLRGALNRHLETANADPKLKYTQVMMKNLDAGRHIAPCVITRLNVTHALTKMHGRMLRVLETHLYVNGHDLCVIASHWTSQLRQRDGTDGDDGRAKYASLIYDVYAEKAARNPDVDLLVCGDFNDTPDSRPVTFDLGATGDRSRVTPRTDKPQLLDLMAGKSPAQFGTIWYGGKPLIYDHICVSPGLLDSAGWSCDPDSVRTVTQGLIRPGSTRREPWRFGDPQNAPTGGRGFSDHFPVTVRLTVAPVAKAAPAKE